MTKHGELTTQQLITIIILIVSFSVILFFIFRMNLQENVSNKEICRNSVVMAGNSLNPVTAKTLDCRTSYICVSGGEKCSGFSETDIIEIDLTKTAEIKNQTMKAIADEMSDCWWMFGEGKVDFIPFDTNFMSYHCGICSVINFAPDVQKENPKGVSYKEFYDYLNQMKKDDVMSYMIYLYNLADLDSLKSSNAIKFPKAVEIDFGRNIDLSQKYNVMIISEYQKDIPDKFPGVYVVRSDELQGANKKLDCKAFDITKA